MKAHEMPMGSKERGGGGGGYWGPSGASIDCAHRSVWICGEAAANWPHLGARKNNAGKAKRMSVISEDTLPTRLVGVGNMIWPRYWPRHKSHVQTSQCGRRRVMPRQPHRTSKWKCDCAMSAQIACQIEKLIMSIYIGVQFNWVAGSRQSHDWPWEWPAGISPECALNPLSTVAQSQQPAAIYLWRLSRCSSGSALLCSGSALLWLSCMTPTNNVQNDRQLVL